MQNDGKIPESTFLRILPDRVDAFSDFMSQAISTACLNGPHVARVSTNATSGATAGTSGGVVTVDHPERLHIGMKVYFLGDTAAVSSACYITAIDTTVFGAAQVTVKNARTSGSAVDLSSYTVADNAKLYMDGAQTAANQFTSLKSSLLANSNTGVSGSGSSTLYGQTKTSYPYLQAVNIDGSGMTAVNVLDTCFDAYTKVRQLGRSSMANELWMSYKHLGNILKQLEGSKGPYNIDQGSTKVSVYGWTEIMVGSVKGSLKLVGMQEMDDDWIGIIDPSALKFFCNGSVVRKRTGPDGRSWFEVRNTTGYAYICDFACMGELVVHAPSKCGILFNISY